MVKRCGKSAPRPWQHGWQAKPRTEQDQIGWPPAFEPEQTARLPRHRVGRLNPSAMTDPEEWSSPRRSAERRGGGDRIRLTARCDVTHMRRFFLALLCAVLAAPLMGGQTPGQIRPRPAEGRQPDFQPPTIREYKPKSTLVVPQHPVPRAKFPVIDIHSHQPTPISPAEFDRVVKGMEENNLRLLINLSGSSGARLRQGVEAVRASKYKDRMVVFANVDFSTVGPGFGVRA